VAPFILFLLVKTKPKTENKSPRLPQINQKKADHRKPLSRKKTKKKKKKTFNPRATLPIPSPLFPTFSFSSSKDVVRK
jgi:hypothetical protein